MDDDPIFQSRNGQWYFFDETWTDTYGPYASREIAEKALDKYVRALGEPEPQSVDPAQEPSPPF